MTKIISMSICPRTVELLTLKCCKTGTAVVGLSACFYETCLLCHRISYTRCFFHVGHSSLGKHYKTTTLTLRSSLDGRGADPSSNSSNGGTRLTRTIQAIQTKFGSRLKEVRKNLPIKLLFFFIGFYCATAFATVIGQTGDWDILSAALAVVVVEGIGALMYRASFPVLNKIRSLITMFNYWKAGLSMGLFLDSFKYELAALFELNDTILFAFSIFFILS